MPTAKCDPLSEPRCWWVEKGVVFAIEGKEAGIIKKRKQYKNSKEFTERKSSTHKNPQISTPIKFKHCHLFLQSKFKSPKGYFAFSPVFRKKIAIFETPSRDSVHTSRRQAVSVFLRDFDHRLTTSTPRILDLPSLNSPSILFPNQPNKKFSSSR